MVLLGSLAVASPASSAGTSAPPPGAVRVTLSAQPGSQLDRIARTLVADDLAASARAGEQPLILVGSARLGAATDRPALFIQLQSPRECGSAGCATSAYAWLTSRQDKTRQEKGRQEKGQWIKVLDGVNGEVAVATTKHAGMADLIVNADRYTWTGTAYASAQPAPAVDLRPRRRRATPTPAAAGS